MDLIHPDCNAADSPPRRARVTASWSFVVMADDLQWASISGQPLGLGARQLSSDRAPLRHALFDSACANGQAVRAGRQSSVGLKIISLSACEPCLKCSFDRDDHVLMSH